MTLRIRIVVGAVAVAVFILPIIIVRAQAEGEGEQPTGDGVIEQTEVVTTADEATDIDVQSVDQEEVAGEPLEEEVRK